MKDFMGTPGDWDVDETNSIVCEGKVLAFPAESIRSEENEANMLLMAEAKVLLALLAETYEALLEETHGDEYCEHMNLCMRINAVFRHLQNGVIGA